MVDKVEVYLSSHLHAMFFTYPIKKLYYPRSFYIYSVGLSFESFDSHTLKLNLAYVEYFGKQLLLHAGSDSTRISFSLQMILTNKN